MSDKKMLNEATVRQMMKLANIPALGEKFIQENYYAYNEQEEEEELEVDAEMPLDDMEAEVVLDEPVGDEGEEAEKLVQDLMTVISDHFPEVEINVDSEVGGEEEIEMDAEVDLEEPMPEEPPVELDGEEELGLDVEVDEEEPVMETDIEEGGLADLGAIAAGEEEEGEADKAFMEEEVLDEEDDGAHNALIDAIAAKVAERLLAEAKKTSE
mgnify:CR=1 FL=1|tara:strand:- start:67 stop:702 length:636 start_codon:yes stop_codon:yes gene_type:complete